ncbi:MAG TPA: hypothetical protein VFF20_00145 [Pseudogracilibacillus sp.]|nr:hypothetical protein [Pseudogracilibacillus sp.]
MKLVHSQHDIGSERKHAVRLFNEEKFDLIHIHLKQGEELSKHHAKTDVLVIVRAGKVEFDFSNEKVTLTNEDILQMDAYEDHSVLAIEETDLILVKIN